jgi:SLT domain-containing protein
MKTIPGMERVITARMPALVGDIEEPIMKMQNPLLGAVSQWVQDKRTDAEFTKVGQAASKGLSTVSTAFAEAFHLGSGTKALDTMMDNLAHGITVASDSIADHAPQIKTFFGTMYSAGQGTAKLTWVVLADGLKVLTPVLNGLGDFADAHPKLFGDLAAGLIAYNVAAKNLPVQGFLSMILGNGATGKVGLLEHAVSLVTKLASVGTGASATLTQAAETSVPQIGSRMAAKTAGSASKLATVANYAGVLAGIGSVIDVGSSIATALTSNKTKEKIKAASKTTGATIGGGIGATLGSIIPGAGTLAGAGIGAAIGDALGSTKWAQSLAKKVQKSVAKATAGLKVKAPKISTDAKALGDTFAKYTKGLNKKMVVSMSTDTKSLQTAATSVNSTYSKMQKSVDNYYKKKEASATADLKKLVANGTLTQKQADNQLAKLKKSDAAEAKSKKSTYTTMQKDATAYYKRAEEIANGDTKTLQTIAKKSGKNSVAYEKEKNKELLAAYKSYAATYVQQEMSGNSKITATVKKGAQQQTTLLKKLTKDKDKLSVQQLDNTAKNAKKEYDAAVKPAQKARDQVIKAAQSRYKETVKTAEKEYKDNGTISKSQYKDIVAKAKAQKDDVVDAADEQYKQTTKHATNQYNSVKKAIEKQKETAIANQYAQYTSVSGYAGSQSQAVVTHATAQANSSNKASKAQAKGTHSIFDGLAKWWNKFIKWFGGSEVKTGDVSYTAPTVSGLAYASGGVVHGSKALVGEAGPELRYSPYSRTVDLLGTRGAEFASVRSGEYILNARDTAKLLAGTYGKTLPGYAGGTTSLDSFLGKIKSGAASIFDHISDAAGTAFEAVTHPIDTLKKLAAKTFNVNSVSGVGSAQRSASAGMRDKGIDAVADEFTKLKKAFDAGSGEAGGKQANPSGESVNRWKPLVKKALAANKLSTSASMVSKVLRQIQTESGGNPKAVQGNIGDINNRTGDLAKGLMQTISTTFNANKFSGHGNIFNGYDNLLAALHYAKGRYGASLSALGQGHGYANGGRIDTNRLIEVAENNKAEYVIPTDITKRSRAWQLLQEVVGQFAGESGTAKSNTTVQQANADNLSRVENKLNQLIGLMEKLGQSQLSLLGTIADKNLNINGRTLTQETAAVQSTVQHQRQQFAGRSLAIDNRL